MVLVWRLVVGVGYMGNRRWGHFLAGGRRRMGVGWWHAVDGDSLVVHAWLVGHGLWVGIIGGEWWMVIGWWLMVVGGSLVVSCGQ